MREDSPNLNLEFNLIWLWSVERPKMSLFKQK